jgi:hypothetical protein
MKRERTKDFDVLRQGSTISIVERRSGVASSFVVPSEEAREALVRVLSDPLEVVETAPSEETPSERVETEVETAPVETEKKTTKKRTTKKGAK